MKHLLSILLICSITLTQELTVDGNLNVTGNIQNQTIDSLVQVIQDLQSQLNGLQGGNRLETRVYELPRVEFLVGNEYDLDISSITGYDLDYAILKIVHVNDFDCSGVEYVNLVLNSTFTHNNGFESSTPHSIELHNTGDIDYGHGGSRDHVVFHNGQSNIYLSYNWSGSGWVDLVLAVTAPFPSDSDVQLRKTGLQSKDKKTAE